MASLLNNYKQLLSRIDSLCRGIESALGEQITCSYGCSSCCTAITLFPVEAAALREALDALPEEDAEAIRRHVADNSSGERCPLLSHNHCLLYEARPIICRTHGLPVTYTEDNQHKSDCCPHNMIDTDSVCGTNVIDIDRLNTLLVAVNSLYVAQAELPESPERLSIDEAIKHR